MLLSIIGALVIGFFGIFAGRYFIIGPLIYAIAVLAICEGNMDRERTSWVIIGVLTLAASAILAHTYWGIVQVIVFFATWFYALAILQRKRSTSAH